MLLSAQNLISNGGGMAEPVLENNEIKQRAVRRLVVAVGLVLVAVGILTYLSYYKPAKVITKPVPDTLAPPPPPIVTGPEPTPVDAAQPLPEPQPIVSTPPTPTQLAPPPPPTVSAKPLSQAGPGPKKISATEAQKPFVKAEAASAKLPVPVVTPAAPAAAPAPAPRKPAPISYVIQFGVFSNPQNAAQLVEKLKQAGIEARTETRVQLPAFKSKAEADAALAKMQQNGISATIVAR
jgi:cell division protein FtsN